MKITANILCRRHLGQKGLFLVEAVIGMSLLGLIFMAMYTGLVTTTFSVQLSRENLRATHVMAERLDTLRLYGWKSVVDDPYYMQGPFTVPVYTDDPSKAGNDATARMFEGEIIVGNAPLTEPYAADLRMVTVNLRWVTGKTKRFRSMSTLISKQGLYKYVY